MKQQPTKGPWKYKFERAWGGARYGNWFVMSDKGNGSRTVLTIPECQSNAKANARLVAASPELLAALMDCKEALRENLSKFDYKNESIMYEAFKKAEAAICKAVGEQI